MDEARRQAYLQAMGVDQFRARSPAVEALEPAESIASTGEAPTGPAPVPASPAVPDVEHKAGSASQPAPLPVASGDDHPDLPPIDAYDIEGELSVLENDYDDSEPEPAATPRPDLSELDWDGLQARVAECRSCGLCDSRTQTVFGVGSRSADLLIVGEAPGAEEDRQGEPFVGRAGQLLTAMLRAIGLEREQVFIANILKCRPPGNRNPSADEARACRGFLNRQVELLQPKLILSLGGVSAHSLLDTDEAVGQLRRRQHSLGEIGLPVLVSYHPAYLLRRPQEKAKSWEDLQRVAGTLARL